MPFDGNNLLAAIDHGRVARGVAVFPIVIEPSVGVTLKHDDARFGELSGDSQGVDKRIESQLFAMRAAKRSDFLDAAGGRKLLQGIVEKMGIDGELRRCGGVTHKLLAGRGCKESGASVLNLPVLIADRG